MQLFCFWVYNIIEASNRSIFQLFIGVFSMLKRHLHFPMIVLVLICVHGICPLLCATAGEEFCRIAPAYAMSADTDTGSSCCHKSNTDKTETPVDHTSPCCSNDLVFVIYNDSSIMDAKNQTEVSETVSIVSDAAIMPASQDILLRQFHAPTLPSSYFHYVISHRGPPFLLS